MAFRIKTFTATNAQDAESQFNTWSLESEDKVSPAQSSDYFKILTISVSIIESKSVLAVLYDTDIDSIV
jgi:hypothetical protein